MAATTDKPNEWKTLTRQCAGCDGHIRPFHDSVHNTDAWTHTGIADHEAPDHVPTPVPPLMVVTKTVQFTLDFTFTQREQFEAAMAARKRGYSQHRILADRLRAEAVRVLRNGGFMVDHDR